MLKSIIFFCLAATGCFIASSVHAQQKGDTVIIESKIDSNQVKNPLAQDTAISKKFNPHTATIRSAILPGWGQAYNKKYWKIPIVYGGLGIAAGFFFDNLKIYRQFRDAVKYKLDTIPGNDTLIARDLRPLNSQSLIFYRNAYRQNIDYSVLAFLIIWGLNVVDATVDAHLKSFDVSPDLSLQVKPRYRFENNSAGISLVFTLRQNPYVFKLPR